jgi:molybdate transport system substrate-binding protein
MMGPTAAETVQLYAAGSLRGALTEIAKVYESSTGNKVEAKYGPSGLLKTEIYRRRDGGCICFRKHGASASFA